MRRTGAGHFLLDSAVDGQISDNDRNRTGADSSSLGGKSTEGCHSE